MVKKCLGLLRPGDEVILHLTETSVNAKKAWVSQCCRVLGLSRSGFYAARKRLRQPEQVDPLSVHAKAAFEASGRSYGSRRLSATLRAKGLNVGRYRARQLMRSNALQTRWRRKFVHTTDSCHELPVAGNVLARRFKPVRPNEA